MDFIQRRTFANKDVVQFSRDSKPYQTRCRTTMSLVYRSMKVFIIEQGQPYVNLHRAALVLVFEFPFGYFPTCRGLPYAKNHPFRSGFLHISSEIFN